MTDRDKALVNLLALERDRLLGYKTDELHMDPQEAVQQALAALEDSGYNPDDVVLPDNQERLDLTTND
jgi:hypothetical protein